MSYGIIGFDTSCYTTSAAVMSLGGQLLGESRRLLQVGAGKRGLRQSEAVFQHVNNLPEVVRELTLERVQVSGVAASVKPRPVPDSYMPVFRAGEGWGRSLAAILKVPFYPVTHQEGHILAGAWSGGWLQGNSPDTPLQAEFLAVHLSGGTTELLRAARNGTGESLLSISIMGGTTDLHAGQLVDRVGVALGLPFPAGPHLEKLAVGDDGSVSIPSSVNGYRISFSGAEAAARRALDAGASPAAVAGAVERCVAKTLVKILRRGIEETGLKDVLVVGGVAANQRIRERLREGLERRETGARLFFAEPRFSGDNAVGVAAAGVILRRSLKGNLEMP